MKVVAGAGPLIALGKLSLLHLVHDVYGPLLLPPAVLRQKLMPTNVSEMILSEQIRDLAARPRGAASPSVGVG